MSQVEVFISPTPPSTPAKKVRPHRPNCSTAKKSMVDKLRQTVAQFAIHETHTKRKFGDTFDSNDFEVERYGQTIDPDYFRLNQGHSVRK